MSNDEEINKLSQEFQEECHETVKAIINGNPKCSHQDATNVWIFRKLAELQIRIKNSNSGYVGIPI
jgi:hypothetical protein